MGKGCVELGESGDRMLAFLSMLFCLSLLLSIIRGSRCGGLDKFQNTLFDREFRTCFSSSIPIRIRAIDAVDSRHFGEMHGWCVGLE